MPARLSRVTPFHQAALLLAASGALALGLAWMHPASRSVAELAGIPTLKPGALNRPGEAVLYVRLSLPEVADMVGSEPGTANTDTPGADEGASAGPATDILFTPTNFDTAIERLLERFHGRERIVVRCSSSGYTEGWQLAKRLRRYGFPRVALAATEKEKLP